MKRTENTYIKKDRLDRHQRKGRSDLKEDDKKNKDLKSIAIITRKVSATRQKTGV